MYAFLKGKVAEVDTENCVIEVSNIGYNVHISTSTAQKLPALGEEVKIYTYTSVREDAIQLYGFLSQSDLNMFKLLITVNGIGPKGALSILSVMDADAIRFAVITGDVKTLSKAPGIGKRTAERMIIDLKGRVNPDDYITQQPIDSQGVDIRTDTSSNPYVREAAEALTALGYSASDALKAVKSIELTEEMGVEEILKAALKNMF